MMLRQRTGSVPPVPEAIEVHPQVSPSAPIHSRLVKLFKDLVFPWVNNPVSDLYNVPTFLVNLILGFWATLFPLSLHAAKVDLSKSPRVLFVANHNIWGLDTFFFIMAVYFKTGLYPRGLGVRFHFHVPFWGQAMYWNGCIEGTRENCAEAMKRSYPLLVYPGGSREVWRKKGTYERYSLDWGHRTGFARMAIQHGYTIVPLAGVGIDDMVYHAWDLPVGQFFKAIKDKKRLDQSVPIVSPHMMLQKQYFKFGEPIFTTGLEVTDETFLKIRDQTERALNQAVEDLKTYRDSDPARFGPHPAVYALAGALLTYLVIKSF